MKIDFDGQKMAIEFDKVPKFLYFNENEEGCGAVFLNGQRVKRLCRTKLDAKSNDWEKYPLKYSIEKLDEETHSIRTIGNMGTKDFVTVGVKVMDLEPFQNVLNIFKQYASDERIPEEARKEFIDKVLNITEEQNENR